MGSCRCIRWHSRAAKYRVPRCIMYSRSDVEDWLLQLPPSTCWIHRWHSSGLKKFRTTMIYLGRNTSRRPIRWRGRSSSRWRGKVVVAGFFALASLDLLTSWLIFPLSFFLPIAQATTGYHFLTYVGGCFGNTNSVCFVTEKSVSPSFFVSAMVEEPDVGFKLCGTEILLTCFVEWLISLLIPMSQS